MRQYTEHGLNIQQLWKDYSPNGIRYGFEYVSPEVFRNVFTHVYNISTRYVLWIILSYTVKIFVYENNLK